MLVAFNILFLATLMRRAGCQKHLPAAAGSSPTRRMAYASAAIKICAISMPSSATCYALNVPAATLCAALGVPPEKENISEVGRPIKLAEGKPIAELLA